MALLRAIFATNTSPYLPTLNIHAHSLTQGWLLVRLFVMHSRVRTVLNLVHDGISVPIQNPFNPFTVGDATLTYNGVPVPVTTGVRFRAINDQGNRSYKTTIHDFLFDTGLRGELGEFGDYFKSWNWELGFRYSRNEEQARLGRAVSAQVCAKRFWIPIRLPRLILFWDSLAGTAKPLSAEFMLPLHQSGEFELPLGYFTVNGDLFNLPAGPVSFAAGVEYRGERWRNTIPTH